MTVDVLEIYENVLGKLIQMLELCSLSSFFSNWFSIGIIDTIGLSDEALLLMNGG